MWPWHFLGGINARGTHVLVCALKYIAFGAPYLHPGLRETFQSSDMNHLADYAVTVGAALKGHLSLMPSLVWSSPTMLDFGCC